MIPVITVSGMGFATCWAVWCLWKNLFLAGHRAIRLSFRHYLGFSAICGVSLLIAVTYVVVNLLIDILYGVIDPRIRYQ